MKKIVYTEKQITEVAAQLVKEVPSKILCLHGDMGAGKTTLIKALVKQLGAIDEASSPTFGIVNVYHSIDETILAYHFDFYRLADEHEALDLGIEDYFNSEAWLFMEWPEKIEALLPEERVDIFIEILRPNTRRISF